MNQRLAHRPLCSLLLTALLPFGAVSCSAEANTPPPAPFASQSSVLAAIDHAKHVTLSAYTLPPDATVVRRLQQRAAAGATVRLLLTGRGFDYALRQNCAILRAVAGDRHAPCAPGSDIRRGRMRVTLTAYPLHAKIAVADGRVFVTATNFTADGLYLRLDSALEPTALRAIADVTGYYGGFTTSKELSLRVEAAMIAQSHGPVFVETESIGDRNPVYDTLLAAAHASRSVTLLVNRRDLQGNAYSNGAVTALEHAGVSIQRVRAAEKIAVVGSTCWVGSSNISGAGLESQVDWGARIDEPRACNYLKARLLANGK